MSLRARLRGAITTHLLTEERFQSHVWSGISNALHVRTASREVVDRKWYRRYCTPHLAQRGKRIAHLQYAIGSDSTIFYRILVNCHVLFSISDNFPASIIRLFAFRHYQMRFSNDVKNVSRQKNMHVVHKWLVVALLTCGLVDVVYEQEPYFVDRSVWLITYLVSISVRARLLKILKFNFIRTLIGGRCFVSLTSEL